MDFLSRITPAGLDSPVEGITDVIRSEVQPNPFLASPLLPLLLLSLATQRYQPKTKETFKSEYDYIIVGAGVGGSVVANRLSEEPCVTVLLLERSSAPNLLTEVPALANIVPAMPDAATLYLTTPQRYAAYGLTGRRIPLFVGKGPGGSSNINDMLYVRGNHRDYDRWVEQGATGWSWKEVFPYFKKLEDNRNQEFVSNGYHGVGGPITAMKPPYVSQLNEVLNETLKDMGYSIIDSNGPTQSGIYELQAAMRDGQRCSAAKAYLVPAENRTNLDIVTDAFVKKVTIVNGRATGVELDYKKMHFEVKARREVVVSAGTILTPKLLMLSGIGPRRHLEKHGIDVKADLPVGRNLQDHMFSLRLFSAEKSDVPYTLKIANPINIQRYITNRTGVLTSPGTVTKMAFLRSGPTNETEDFPQFELYFEEPSYMAGLGLTVIGLRPEIINSNFVPLDEKPAYPCLSSLLHPRSRGTITLRSSDPYDHPRINPNYFKNKKDVDDIVAGMKECDKIYNSRVMKEKLGMKTYRALYPGCAKYQGNETVFYRCIARTLSLSFWHLVGTAKMGQASDPTTVVDPQLRVKNVRGLRVVDASIMPLVTSGNTYIPTAMIGEKASDMIKKTILCN